MAESKAALDNITLASITQGYNTDPFCKKLAKVLLLQSNCEWRDGLMMDG